MRTTPEQRADLRADVSGPWGRYMLAEDLRALLDDLDDALAEVAALRAMTTASVREAELLAEVGRLRAVIRTGGAMLRAERSALGVPGGVEPDEVAALRAVAEAARARCRDAVPEWAPELRAALRAWEERST